jgi:uncharacterized membrane protein
MEAIKWGLYVYRSDLAKAALPVVVLETISLLATLIVPRVLGSMLRSALYVTAQAPSFGPVTLLVYLLGVILGIVTVAYAAAGLYPYLLNLARGRPVELSEAFRPGPHFPNVLKLTALLLVAASLGFMLCALPGMAIIAVGTLAFPKMVDHDLDAVTALRQTFEQAKQHFLTTLIFGLLCIAITLVGAALCVVGAVLVSVPVVMLAQVYVYLCLEGEVPVGADAV